MAQVSLAAQKLAAERLSARQVAVTLYPGGTVDLESALLDILFDLGKQRGVFLLYPLKVKNGGHKEGIFRVATQHLYRVGNGAHQLSLGLLNRPEPGRIQVRMPDNANVGALSSLAKQGVYHRLGRGNLSVAWNDLLEGENFEKLQIGSFDMCLGKAVLFGLIQMPKQYHFFIQRTQRLVHANEADKPINSVWHIARKRERKGLIVRVKPRNGM